MKKRNISAEDVTKGEVIVIIAAFIIWSLLAVVFNNMIKNHTLKENEKYYKAIQIDNDKSRFEYAIRTDAGNALVHGKVSAIDAVTIPELTGEYLAVRVKVEKYTQKSKKVEDKNEDGEVIGSHIETWEEWDYYRSETKTCEKVKFLGTEFDYSKFDLSKFERVDLNQNVTPEYVKRVRLNHLYERDSFFEHIGDLRYTYYVIPKSEEVTIFASLREKSIYDVKVHYKSIPEVMESIEKSKNVPNIVFTIIWYIIFAGGAYFFAMHRNKWLDL